MSRIKDMWEMERLAYQQRYAKSCERFKEGQEKEFGEFAQGEYKGAMLERSWVLINIFGLSSQQVNEVERNKGFTNNDLE